MPTEKLERRSVLGTVGLGAMAVVAGCLGGEEDDEADEPTNDGGEDEPTDEEPDAAIDEPVAFPEDDNCAVCNMVAAEYPEWNAQLVHEDGHREYFCSKGCLVAYTFAPAKFTAGDPDEPIVGVWATSFESGDLVDATESYFVYEQDRERQSFPMPRGSPLAFEERDDAVAYIEEHDDLSVDEHLIELDDVDREIAEFYRAPRLEDER